MNHLLKDKITVKLQNKITFLNQSGKSLSTPLLVGWVQDACRRADLGPRSAKRAAPGTARPLRWVRPDTPAKSRTAAPVITAKVWKRCGEGRQFNTLWSRHVTE